MLNPARARRTALTVAAAMSGAASADENAGAVPERFVAALRLGVNGTPDFRRAATVQQVLDRCIDSSAEGRWLTVS